MFPEGVTMGFFPQLTELFVVFDYPFVHLNLSWPSKVLWHVMDGTRTDAESITVTL